LLENIQNNQKSKFYKVINIILAVSTISGLVLPWFLLSNYNSSDKANLTISLTSIAGFLRFLTGGKNQMLVDITVHNAAIAVLGFILSFLSHGVLGCVFLFLNSFLVGMVLYGVHDFQTILFVFLEILGICVAAFGGTILAKKRNENNLSLSSVFKYSGILILIITIIYFLAAIIESNLIINRWS